MKKKGFTLIELLAVIVILAVIALITIPMIMNVIETSKKEAFKDSVLSAFNEVEYYVLENDLGDVPKEGIEVKNLKLKNNNFQYGIIRKDENGALMAEEVSDGEYCAVGTINNLSVTKGECDTGAPTGEVTVDSKKATITLRDDQGVIGYEITKNEEASSWTTIEVTKEIVVEYEASEAGTYYVHIKDKFGKTNRISFIVENSAFCAYKPGDVVATFDYKGNVEEFQVPCSGIYKLEVYGSQGENTTSSYRWSYTGYNPSTDSKTGTGANGTYVYGYTNLSYQDKLYINVGGLAYNGGGKSSSGGYTVSASLTDCKTTINVSGGAGGGATDIRLNGNELENRIIVAGGGSGGTASGSAWTYHYAGGSGTTNTSQSLSSTNANTKVTINDNLFSGNDATYASGTITGAGGGGYYGGNNTYLGSSYIDMNRFFNYDISTKTKTTITYNGTNGQNDFISDNVVYNNNSGTGIAKITLVSY